MKVKVYNQSGAFLEDREYNVPIFDGDRGIVALKFTIDALLANMRQGNASTKTRSYVRGGGKKPFRQKGTGNAREGSRRSPLMPGGGIVFGPHPRSYAKKVNDKVRRLALARSLYDCSEEMLLSVVDEFPVASVKTRDFKSFLDKIFPVGDVLLIDVGFSDNLVLSARNLNRVYMVDAASLNALDLKSYDHFLASEAGFLRLLERVK